MEHVFENREACLQAIRSCVGNDAGVARYVLMAALQELDLGGLNAVRLAAETLASDLTKDRLERLELLLQERWG